MNRLGFVRMAHSFAQPIKLATDPIYRFGAHQLRRNCGPTTQIMVAFYSNWDPSRFIGFVRNAVQDAA